MWGPAKFRHVAILRRYRVTDIYRFLLAKAGDITDIPESAAVSSVSRLSDTKCTVLDDA